MVVIYNTASLFNAREKLHNILLTEALDKHGHDCILPQRDGFEFSALHELLKEMLPAGEDAAMSLQTIIFLLDMGFFIPKSDAVVACLDEPVDEALVLEVTAGAVLGKRVIGWRSDVRSPFGSLQEPFKGMHFFIPMFCDTMINETTASTSATSAQSEVDRLAARVHEALQIGGSKGAAVTVGVFIDIIEAANLIFDGIEDVHGLHKEQNMRQIVSRYILHREKLDKLRPRVCAMPIK
eukprot:GFYU01012648.1.p1 GENE.GFYU01012648.1~~GFYU01012648.1.p1  ORF type:complete len:238 (+),score=39.52 GFYU01012648.1:22-735(+)